MQKKYKVIIVGAGPAGIGNAVALKHLGLDENDFVILERDDIGSSLKKWPKEMKFITPSFTGNQFGMVDMNSITPDTSPAFTMRKEHLSGDEYARYLEILVNHYKIPIESGVEVKDVNKENDNFIINTNEGSFTANYLIWCGGEFQFPNLTPFNGSENCIHNTHIDSYKNLEADKYVVIGGYESGIDATVNLAKLDKEVTVIDSGKPWEEFSSDPSAVLSTYTYERLHNLMPKGKIELVSGFRVSRVDKTDNGFTVVSEEGEEIYSEKKPILCTGFNCSTDIIKDLFKKNEYGDLALTDKDESTITENLFLSGPMVRQKKVIFCFIYKFRQRFPVIAAEIGKRMGLSNESLESYKKANMYLEDLSCCEQECSC